MQRTRGRFGVALAVTAVLFAAGLDAQAQASRTRPGGGGSSAGGGSSGSGGSPPAQSSGRATYGHGGGHSGGHGGYAGGYYGHGYHSRPYYGRHYGQRSYYDRFGALDLQGARQAGLGGLDLNVSPKRRTEVYLDGKYVGVVGNFDGYPSYLWLKEGTHQLVLYRNGYLTMARDYRIHPGVVIDVRLRMERGESVPPEQFMAELAKERSGDGHESS